MQHLSSSAEKVLSSHQEGFNSLQVAELIERCLQRNPAERPSAKDIFDQLRSMLPASSGPKPVLVNTARSGSLAPVVETEELVSRSSDQSGVGSDIMEYETEFRRPQRGEGYSTSDEGSSISRTQEFLDKGSHPVEDKQSWKKNIEDVHRA